MKENKVLLLSVLASALIIVISGCVTPTKDNKPKPMQTIPPQQVDPAPVTEQPSTEQAPEKKDIRHKIKSGDTLSDLAEKYYGKSDKYRIIAEYNDLKENSFLKVGQIILIPVTDGQEYPDKLTREKGVAPKSHTKYIKHSIQPGETLSDVAKIYYDSYSKWRILAKQNGLRKNTNF